MKKQTHDVIVVGSGLVGSYAAKCFTEAGKTVLCIESGHSLDEQMIEDAEHMAGDEFKKRYPEPMVHEPNPELIYKGAYDTWGQDVDKMSTLLHKDDDFINQQDTVFSWVHFDVVGGRSLMWGRVVPRLARHDFVAASLDGYGINWPLSYSALESYYNKVETYLGVAGHATDHDEMPRGIASQGENRVGRMLESLDGLAVDGHKIAMIQMPQATLKKPHQGRSVVSQTLYGEIYDNIHPDHYNALHGALKDAKITELLTLKTNQMVTRVLLNDKEDQATGVEVVDRNTKQTIQYHADLVFLCASTVCSTKILLNSQSTKHPNGLGNHSGQLGRYLMDHMFIPGASGFVPMSDKDFQDPSNFGVGMIPRFVNAYGIKKEKHIRSFQYQCFVVPALFNQDRKTYIYDFSMNESGDGGTRVLSQENQGGGDQVKQAEDSQSYEKGALAIILGFGEMLGQANNRLTLSQACDDYGIRKIVVDAHYGKNDKQIIANAKHYAKLIMKKIGAKAISDDISFMKPYLKQAPLIGLGIHEMGTARMGNDPKQSVLNANNQVWGVSNVYCTDGACMPSNGVANPSLTYMALTQRAVDHALLEHLGGNKKAA